MHKDPDYSCVYVVLKTDDPVHTEAYGLTFTLGRGNEVAVGSYPIVTFQYSSTTLYQFSYHIQ